MAFLVDPSTLRLLALSFGAALSAGYYTVALFRVRRSQRSAPSLRESVDAPEPSGGWPKVCVIVPAHNEADVVGVLASSLRAQEYPGLRVVFALDRCTDDTERVARDALDGDERFEIVLIDACPEDWAGKTHAAWSGLRRSVAASDADMLLFTDADTQFDPVCVRACVAHLLAHDLQMLSLLSALTHDRWFELVVQPSASLELLRQNPLDRVNRRNAEQRAFANGQFMLFRREAYEALGGHEAVRGALLEDLAFARRMAKSGLPFGVLPAEGLLRCRMYRSWSQFTKGWGRIFTEAARRRPGHLSKFARKALLSGVAAPLASVGALGAGLASGGWASWAGGWASWTAIGCGGAGTLAWVITKGAIYRAQRAPLWALPAAPVGAALTAWILWRAGRALRKGRGITWAGRTYATEAQGRV